MSPRSVSNSKLPGSSSSVSLNESPTDEINYDSDISEDDHAIAEGDDDEYDDEEEEEGDDDADEDEPDEGFAVEVNTLTGNTFNVMIHPSDTVEVLKTRIAFQEGISPADQNLLLEQGKLLDSTTGGNDNTTLQELNIDRNSKLTLVTNVVSGVPFKTPPVNPPGGTDNNNEDMHGYGNVADPPLSSSSPSYKLAPTIKRNYNNNSNGNSNHQLKYSTTSSSTSSSLRLPKILTLNQNANSTVYHRDKNGNNNIVNGNGGSTSNMNGAGGTMNRNIGQTDSQQSQLRAPRLDEREWMKSLFNKVAHQNEEEDSMLDHIINVESGCSDSPAKIVIDIDSTSAATSNTALLPPRISTRYVGTKYSPEEDGSLLVVQGDDGVILIIQKNTGQLLEKTYIGDKNNNSNGFGEQVGSFDGRIGRMGRHTSTMETRASDTTSSMSTTSYRRSRYQEENRLVNEKIKENAVTLEKMRQVRSLMAQHKRERDQNREKGKDKSKTVEGVGERRESVTKTVEFPKISEGSGRNGIKPLGVRNGAPIGYRGSKTVVGVGRKKSAVVGGSRSLRSINSSKMSLNRLIAEIYLQSKRKDRHAFQPGQPPYTDQQLLRYVYLKTAILLDEQKRNKTEPCMKCQLDENWSFNEAGPYLIPTVVMNRYRRIANGRNSKSLDKEEANFLDEDDTLRETDTQRRKSMIPVVVSTTKPAYSNGCKFPPTNKEGRRDSFIPRLILVNRERNGGDGGGHPHNPSSVATTNSTVSRRSSSSMTIKIGNGIQCVGTATNEGGGAIDRANVRINTCNTKVLYPENDEEYDDLVPNDEDEGICESIIITSNGVSNGKFIGGRPSYRVHPKMYCASNGFGGKIISSRPEGIIKRQMSDENWVNMTLVLAKRPWKINMWDLSSFCRANVRHFRHLNSLDFYGCHHLKNIP